jgi:acetyl/propionyl-CoA carboxylase alpha subunit
MFKANVPITPGYYGSDQSDAVLKAEAEKIGCDGAHAVVAGCWVAVLGRDHACSCRVWNARYPVMIKAVFGGGGRVRGCPARL